MAKKCKPFRVAVIGCSGEAEKHIAALIAAPETKLVAFCDVDKRLVKEYKKKYKIRRGYTNYLRMMRRCLFRRRPDAVHICLTSASRASLAEYCMMQKSHVMIEPPLAFDMGTAASAIRTASYMDKVCGVLLPARANATTAYVKEALAAGRLGRILSAKSVICAPTAPKMPKIYDPELAEKTAAILLFSVAAPAIDLVDILVDEESRELSCSMANRTHTDAPPADSVEGVVTYASGIKHSFYCTSNYENGGSSQISLLCEHGEIIFDADDVRIVYEDDTKDEMHDDNSAMGCLDEVRDFYNAIREGRTPLTEASTAMRLNNLLLGLYFDAMKKGINRTEPKPIVDPNAGTKKIWY